MLTGKNRESLLMLSKAFSQKSRPRIITEGTIVPAAYNQIQREPRSIHVALIESSKIQSDTFENVDRNGA